MNHENDPFASDPVIHDLEEHPLIVSLLQEINDKNSLIQSLQSQLNLMKKPDICCCEKGIQTEVSVSCDIGVQVTQLTKSVGSQTTTNGPYTPPPHVSHELLDNLRLGRKWWNDYLSVMGKLGIDLGDDDIHRVSSNVSSLTGSSSISLPRLEPPLVKPPKSPIPIQSAQKRSLSLKHANVESVVKRRRIVSSDISIPTSKPLSQNPIPTPTIVDRPSTQRPASSGKSLYDSLVTHFQSVVVDKDKSTVCLNAVPFLESSWIDELKFGNLNAFRIACSRFWDKDCRQLDGTPDMVAGNITIILPNGSVSVNAESVSVPRVELGPILWAIVLYNVAKDDTHPISNLVVDMIKVTMLDLIDHVNSTNQSRKHSALTQSTVLIKLRWFVLTCNWIGLLDPLRVFIIDLLSQTRNPTTANELLSHMFSLVPTVTSILESPPCSNDDTHNGSDSPVVDLPELIKIIMSSKVSPASLEKRLKTLFVSFQKKISSFVTNTRSLVVSVPHQFEFEAIKYVAIISSHMDGSYAYYFIRKLLMHVTELVTQATSDKENCPQKYHYESMLGFVLDLIAAASPKVNECDEAIQNGLKSKMLEMMTSFPREWQGLHVKMIQILTNLNVSKNDIPTEMKHLLSQDRNFSQASQECLLT